MFHIHKVSENLKMTKYKTYKEFGINIKEKDIEEVYKENKSHNSAFNMGFKVDNELDAYILESFGVFLQNIPAEIKNINDLLSYTLKDGSLLYGYYKKYIDKGFNFAIGPAFPSMAGTDISNFYSGLYCKNYLEMIEKEK